MESFRNQRISLGVAVKNERVSQGLTQEQLASMIGTSKSHIWRIENGKVSTTIGCLAQIAEALGVKASALIKF